MEELKAVEPGTTYKPYESEVAVTGIAEDTLARPVDHTGMERHQRGERFRIAFSEPLLQKGCIGIYHSSFPWVLTLVCDQSRYHIDPPAPP